MTNVLTKDFKDKLADQMIRAVKSEISSETWKASVDGSNFGYVIYAPVFDESNEIIDLQIVDINDTAIKAAGDGFSYKSVIGAHILRDFGDPSIKIIEACKQAYLTQERVMIDWVAPSILARAGSTFRMAFIPTSNHIVSRNVDLEMNQDGVRILQSEIQSQRIDTLEKIIREIAHDLRTPMAVIKTSLYLSEKNHLTNPEKAAEYHTQAFEQIDQLQSMLEELVDMVRIKDSGLQLEILDASILCEPIADSMESLAVEKGCKLTFVSRSGCCILAAPDKLYRAIANIIRNAISYTKTGGTIEVSVIAEQHNILISVEDTGVGIPADKVKKIFDRFYRVNPSEGDGNNKGLGLSIAQEIVEMHGGTISVDSEFGVGTVFTIALPRVNEAGEAL